MVKRTLKRKTVKRRPKASKPASFVPKEVYHDDDSEGAGTEWELYNVAPGNHFVGILWGGDNLDDDEYACFGPFNEPLGRAIESLGDEIDSWSFMTENNSHLRDKSERRRLVMKYFKEVTK